MKKLRLPLAIIGTLWLIACQEEVPAPLAYISGVVKNGDQLVPDAKVVLLDADGVEIAGDRTNDAGYFLFEDLSLGDYEVVASAPGFDEVNMRVSLSMPGVEGVSINLNSLLSDITGVVFDDISKVPLAQIPLSLEADGQMVMTAETDDFGAFRFQNVEIGEYELRVDITGYDSFTSTISVLQNEDFELEIPLASNRSGLSGTVYHQVTRAPLDRVKVRLLQASEPLDSVVTDEYGEFMFSDVESGDYQLQAFKEDYFSLDTTFTLAANEDPQFRLNMALAIIDPSDPNLLSSNLDLNGTLVSGSLPIPSQSRNAPSITNNQSSASVTSDNALFVPFTFSADQQLTGVFLQVEDALTYWDVPISPTAGNDQWVLSVGIPGNVLTGTFNLSYCVYDSRGLISRPVNLSVTIVESQTSCDGFTTTISESGSDGLTIRTYDLGTGAGTVSLSYDMYVKPDRVDIFYDNTWVAGTGSTLGFGGVPPASTCFTPSEGYVSGRNTLSFSYDGSVSRRVDVVTSGCFGGTAWDYTIACPQ